MKKILAVLIFLLISTTNSFAVIFVDGFGAYINAGDMENQLGGGLGFGFDISRNLNLLFRAADTTVTKDKNKLNEVTFEHTTILGGVEFVPVIPALNNYRVDWKTSLLAGISDSNADFENFGSESEMGFACSLWTGLQFNLTQVVSPFIDLGYHYSFYNDKMKNASIRGYQIAFGIRFYLTGNRDYSGDYQ